VIDTDSSWHRISASNFFFLWDTPLSKAQEMTDKEPDLPRYLVREGYKGWMVYDRQRKGPALVGTDPAVNLRKEQADRIQRLLLTAKRKQNES